MVSQGTTWAGSWLFPVSQPSIKHLVLPSEFLCRAGRGSLLLLPRDTKLTDVKTSQKTKDREGKKSPNPTPCTVQCPPIFLLVPITVKSIYRALITKGSWMGRGGWDGYKPIKNILTFEYHNGGRGWLLPRLPPTEKRAFFFAFLYPPTLIPGNFGKMRLDTCAWEIKHPTHSLSKRFGDCRC